MPCLSVVIPVYNSEDSLCRCVRSILQQTFSDWEVILIDDGSTDSSGQICDLFANSDSRIKVIHKYNGGVSSARNAGLSIATGTWITFVDSDDYVANTYFSEMLSYFNVDLVVSGVYYINSKLSYTPPSSLIAVEDHLDIVDKQLTYIYSSAPWAKIYRADIIAKYGLKFNEHLRVGEDTDFVFRYMLYVRSIQFLSKALYYYNDFEAKKLYKYSLCASDFKKYVVMIMNSLDKLKSKYDYDFVCSSHMIKDYYRRLFYANLMKINSYDDFKKEAISFRNNKCRYYSASKFKELLMTYLMSYCPIVMYWLLSFKR